METKTTTNGQTKKGHADAATATLAPVSPAVTEPTAAHAAKPTTALSILDAVKTLSAATATPTASPAARRENDVARIEKELPAITAMIATTLKTDVATLDKCAAIAADILKKTDALAVPASEGESAEPFYGTPAVVFFNVLHSVGHFATRLDAMRQTLRNIDRAQKTAYLSKFEREFAVFLALKMNVPRTFLDSLPDRDLTVTRF